MVAEWDAELAHEGDNGRPWSCVGLAWGAFADASALREVAKREERRMTTAERLAGWRNEVGHALRGLGRAPAFTLVAVLTLGIGLGGSAGIYTLLDQVVLDPLPYPDSGRLVRLANQVPGVGPDEVWHLSTAQYVYFGENASTLGEIGLYRGVGGNIVTASGPERARTALVTASMMDLLGARARLGRLITESDDRPGAPTVALLSDGFWTRALGADAGVVGTTITLDDEPIEIVGVLEPGLELPGWSASLAPDLWLPMQVNRSGGFSNSHVFPSIARLAEGATPESAEAELARMTPTLPGVYPNVYSESFFEQYGFRSTVRPLKEDVLGDLGQHIWLLFGGVGMVLVIACANVANLFLVRIEGKRRELGIRIALGADRPAIARFLLAEAMTLALGGALLAVLVGWQVVPLLTALAPDDLPRISGTGLDAEAVLFTFGLATTVGLALALVPFLGRVASGEGLADGGRSSTLGPGGQRLRSSLVVAQMALAITLLVGAGLLVETLRGLYDTDTGVDQPGAVLAVDIYMNPQAYPNDVDLWPAYREIEEGVRALPGVVEVGMGEQIPVSGGFGCVIQGFEDVSIYDRIREAGLTTCAGQTRVTPGYFEALGIPLVEGRYLDEADHADPMRSAVVVSEAFAGRFFPEGSVIGRGIGPGGRTIEPFYHVVGIVGDVAQRSEEGRPPLSQDAIAIYYPVVGNPEVHRGWGGWWAGWMTLLVRTADGDPTELTPAIRRVVSAVDPEIPVVDPRSMADVVDEAMVEISFLSLLLGLAAMVAVTLAGVGLYGVVAYVVSRKTREIGMRLAIGAQPGEVVRGVVARTLGLVAIGLVLGVPLAVLTSRVGRSLLVGVEPTAPSAYVAAAAVIGIVAVAASWLPARRAARIDPVEALRVE